MKTNFIFNEIRWRWLLWFVSAIAICALMARSVSPLFPFDGWDSAVYRMVGDCWLRGALPYVDVFDNKGPYLYLIQAIGSWLGGGRWGIFVLVIINFTLIIELVWQITGLILNKVSLRLCALAVFLLHFLLMFERGNLTEDWSMTPILLSLWLAMRRLSEPTDLQIGREVYVYGLCFGVVTLTRPTNSIVFAGIIIGFSTLLLRHKQYKILEIATLRFIVGAALAIVPMVIYFYLHHALDDAFYCLFIHNFIHLSGWSSIVECNKENIFILMLPCLIPIFSTVIYDRTYKYNYSLVLIPTTILFVLIYYDQPDYVHYYALISPLIAIAFAMALNLHKHLLSVICVALLLPSCYLKRAEITSLWKIQPPSLEYIDGSYNGMQCWADYIPTNQRDDVMLFDTGVGECALYTLMQTVPPMRFTHLTTQLMAVDPALRAEVDEYLRHNNPQWILISSTSNYPLMQQKLTQYTLVAEDSYLRLFRQHEE